MTKKRLIWFQGDIIPVEEAKINVLTPTCQFGANVFEGMRCYWNDRENQLYGFKILQHLERLLNSVKLIGFESKYNLNDLIESFKEIIIANNYKEDIVVRQTIFLNGFGSWNATGPTDMFIAPIPKGRSYGEEEGIHCCISSWERINDRSLSPKIKAGANYINSRMGQLEAVRNGYDSAIFLNNQGKVSESSGSCIFMIREGCLITPPITASILESITRLIIINIAKEDLGCEVIERDIDRTELYLADEIFLCGTAMEIAPVINIDKLLVGTGKIGTITNNLQGLYLNIARGKVNKYINWLTPIYK
ncbi:branched-chain amino acid transaminase [Bacteroidota bacterium]